MNLIIAISLVTISTFSLYFTFKKKSKNENGEKIKNYSKFILWMIGFLIGFFTIFNKEFAQNEYDLTLPFKNLNPYNSNEINLEELFANINKKPIFIYAIDVSKSMSNAYNDSISWKPITTINNINNHNIQDETINISENSIKTTFGICTLKLSDLIAELEGGKGYFSVWAFDKDVYKYFPADSLYADINKINIDNCTKILSKKFKSLQKKKINQSFHRNYTNFTNLFSELKESFDIQNSNIQSDKLQAQYKLIVLSDLIHDNLNDPSEAKKEDFKNDKSNLEDMIEELSQTSLRGNMIIPEQAINLSKEDIKKLNKINRVYIYPLLKDKFLDDKLGIFSVSDHNHNYIFDDIKVEKSLDFEYVNDKFIDSTSITIIVPRTAKYLFNFQIDPSNQNHSFNLYYGVLNNDNKMIDDENLKGRMKSSERSNKWLELREGDKVVFFYSGKIPKGFDISMVIKLEEVFNFSYSVPVYFKKRLHFIISIIFLLIIGSILITFIILLYLLGSKSFRQRERTPRQVTFSK